MMKDISTLLWRALILGLLLVAGYLGMPHLIRKQHRDTPFIINNLRQLDGAVQTWALEQKQTGAVPVTWQDIRPYIRQDPGEAGSKLSVAGERYVLKPLPQPPEAVLTRRVQGRPKGTVIRLTTNGVEFIPPR